MKNNMTYEEAVKELKRLEMLQTERKRNMTKTHSTFPTLISARQSSVQRHKKQINYLLSLIHAHKQARKLYAEVEFYKKQYGG